EHRPEDLLLRDRHLVVDLIEDRRLHIIAAAFVAGALAAEDELRALALALVDIAQHPLHLSLVDNGAHGRLWIEGIARLQLPAYGEDLFQNRVLHRFLDDQSRARVADLTLVEEDAPGSGRGRRIEVRAIRHDDVRSLATAFERDALHVAFAGIAQ